MSIEARGLTGGFILVPREPEPTEPVSVLAMVAALRGVSWWLWLTPKCGQSSGSAWSCVIQPGAVTHRSEEVLDRPPSLTEE